MERLLRLAFDPGATDGEAVAAFRKAREYAVAAGGLKSIVAQLAPGGVAGEPMPVLMATTYWSGIATFHIKEYIRHSLGGTWDGDRRCWVVPPQPRSVRQFLESNPRRIFGVAIVPVGKAPTRRPRKGADL